MRAKHPRRGAEGTYRIITVSAAAAFCNLQESPTQTWAMPRNWNATPTGQVTTSRMFRMAKPRRLPHLRNGGTCLTMSWYWIKVMVFRPCYTMAWLAKKSLANGGRGRKTGKLTRDKPMI